MPRPQTIAAAPIELMPPARGVDWWPVWDVVQCPTLVLRGARIQFLLEATAARMTERGPRARVAEFAGIGHAPWLMVENQIRVVREFCLHREAGRLQLQVRPRPMRLVLAEPSPRQRV